MFDTVRLKAKGVYIDPARLENMYNDNQDKMNRRRNITDDGEIVTSYDLHIDKQLPYIKYVESSKTLYIQVSIPKFLYGDNITMVTETDVTRFFDRLQERLEELLGFTVTHEQWFATRIDLCYNFEVDSVSDCIKQIAKMKLPRKNTVLYNHSETVVFSNKSSQVKFYDKEEQYHDIRARGILRMEIEPSDADLRKFTKSRRAVDLLTKRFFLSQVEIILPHITEKLNGVNPETFSDEWLRSASIQNIEKAFTFGKLQQEVDESTLIDLYGKSTYRNRLSLVKSMKQFAVKRFDLTIDDRKLG